MKKLKVNFQKILCIIVACVLAFSVLTLPASADTSLSDNTSHFISRTKSNYEDYRSGKISFADFLAAVTVDISRYGMVAGVELTGIPDILDFLKSFGIDVENPWEQFYFQHHGGGGSSGNRDEILKGYGAVAQLKDTSFTGYITFTEYCEYIVIDVFSNGVNGVAVNCQAYIPNANRDLIKPDSGNISFPADLYYFYGDVRNSDGSSADDYTTQIPDDPAPGYDDESVTQDELEDFLEDLLNDLSLEFPDLSTIEGILAAILAKLGSLDSDDDAGALAAIQTAISQLSSVNSADSQKIISALNNISSGSNFDFVKLKTTLNDWIGLNGDYSEISKLEIVKDKFNKKIGFVSSFSDLCGKVVKAYTKTSSSVSFDISLYGDTHIISFDWLEPYMPTFRIMLCAFIYISYAWRTYRKVPEYISGGGEDT